MTRRVVITGASGFVGRHCVEPLLRRGYEVHMVGRRRFVEDSARVRWHRLDLLADNAIAGLLDDLRASHLLHLAWCTTPGLYWTARENLAWVRASVRLMEAFAQSGGQRIVTSGTCAEYEWKQGALAEQSTPLKPRTLYGICKLAVCDIFDAFARQAGISAAWGRLFFLYGPNEQPERLVASVCSSLLANKEARTTDGAQIRDLLYVEDAADALVALLDSPVTGSVNIASGQGISLSEVVGRVASKLGRTHLLKLGAIPCRPEEPAKLVADVSRLTSELGWQPRVGLDEGLDRTIAWWSARLSEEGA